MSTVLAWPGGFKSAGNSVLNCRRILQLKVTYDFLFHNMNFIDVFKDKKVVIV